GDREVLALANSVVAHRRLLGRRRGGEIRVLLLATEGGLEPDAPAGVRTEVVLLPKGPPSDEDLVSDLFGLVPRRFRALLANPAAQDSVRHALADRDFDLVHVRGLEAASVAGRFLERSRVPAVLQILPLAPPAGFLERAREENFLLGRSRPYRR